MAVAAAGDVDRRPTGGAPVSGRVVVAEFVHPLEVEPEGAALTVDLESVLVVEAGGQARRLERRDAATAQPGQERDRVVHGARPHRPFGDRSRSGDLATRVRAEHRTFLDEGLLDRTLHRADLLAGDEPDRIDDVGVQVAVRSRPCDIALEPPEERSRRAAPTLQVDGAGVIHPTQGAGGHQLVGERHGGDAPVVVPDEGLACGGCRRGGHRLGVGQRSCERLLAGDVLAGLERGDRLFGMDVVRRADVDQVDGIVGDRGGASPSTSCAIPSARRTPPVRPRSDR